MANIILPAVPILNEIDDSTKLLIEQAGEINRYPISDLDIGGGDVTIDLSNNDETTDSGNPINADTLGGKPASDYILKDELILDNIGGGGAGDITVEIESSEQDKPQSPLYSASAQTHFYPLTTADQVIVEDEQRLDDVLNKYLIIDFDDSNAAQPNSINADTLGGIHADQYVTKDILDNSFIKLNFSVVGGTIQPSNPTENMIWVNTDTEITKVVFKSIEPIDPIEDMVCIYTGASSNVSFDRIVINGIGIDEVCPIFAKQYIGGEWVTKTAKSWQNGKWVDWITYLFKSGEGAQVDFEIYQHSNCSITQSADSIVISHSAIASGEGYWLTQNKYDLSNKKQIVFLAHCTANYIGTDTGYGYSTMFVVTSTKDRGSGFLLNRVAERVRTEYGQKMEYTVDVSSLNGEYYLGYSGIGNLTIYDVYVR